MCQATFLYTIALIQKKSPFRLWCGLELTGFFPLKVHQCSYENVPISSSSHKNNMLKVSHYDTVYFLRYTLPRYINCLFANI